MLLEILISIALGIMAGTITGLIPGIHINLVGAFIISLSTGILLKVNEIYLIVFITAMAITHTFIDFIPSIFLGCPDGETELSVLPGHELLKEGKGHEAIMITTYASLAAIFILVIAAFPSIFIFKVLYEPIKKITPFLLIFVIIILISLEKNKFKSLTALLLTGALGYFALNFEIIKEPLLPLLTGLFGSSMLILSIKQKTKIPPQKITYEKPKLKRPLIGSAIASPLCSFLPGLGSGQAAIIGNIFCKQDRKGFIALVGATNTLVMGFSFFALYAISKTRTGAAVAISELAPNLTINKLILILVTITITGIAAFYLTKNLSIFFSKHMQKINYEKLTIGTLIFLGILITLISGVKGFVFLIISTLTGIYCIGLGVRRTNMMGCLLIPVIIFYLFG
ncbi:MAG: tripartite tricarboxylate transporter permease [Nanoarchaeota archaeon]|nr:tripartite tricarboxylate transporter permease [Nanoarchaeota archaeon]